MHDLTGFQRDLLRVIAANDGEHGLLLKSKIESYYNDEVNHGRLYPNLDTLTDMGLVKKGVIDRRTNSYSLTRRGKRELVERDEWNDAHSPSDAPPASAD